MITGNDGGEGQWQDRVDGYLVGAKSLLNEAVQDSTKERYECDWARYRAFMSLGGRQPSLDQLLLVGVSERRQVEILAAYIGYAFQELGLAAGTVIGSLSGIRHYFRKEFGSVEVFSHPVICTLRSAMELEHRKRCEGRVRDQKLPFTLGMVERVVERARKRGTKDAEMTAVAIQIAFFCLLRVSEYVPSTKRLRLGSCHALRAGDVQFELQQGSGTVWQDATEVHPDQWPLVRVVRFHLRSMKNDELRTGSVFWFKNLQQEGGVNIVRVTFDWAVKARLQRSSFFMSYQVGDSGKYKWLSYGRVSTAIKSCAVSFGFRPSEFGTHSPRVGGACTLRAGDTSDSMIKLLGRWKSLMASLGYQGASFKEFDRLQSILAKSDVFTAGDVKLIHRKLQAAGPDGAERAKYTKKSVTIAHDA